MAAWTSVRTSGLTRGEPLTTRETVARDTPAEVGDLFQGALRASVATVRLGHSHSAPL